MAPDSIKTLHQLISEDKVPDYEIHLIEYEVDKDLSRKMDRFKKQLEEGKTSAYLGIFRVLGDLKNAFHAINQIEGTKVCVVREFLYSKIVDGFIVRKSFKDNFEDIDKFVIYHPTHKEEDIVNIILRAWDIKFRTSFGLKKIYLIVSNEPYEKEVINNVLEMFKKEN